MAVDKAILMEEHAKRMIAEIEEEERNPENWKKNKHAEEALSVVKTKED